MYLRTQQEMVGKEIQDLLHLMNNTCEVNLQSSIFSTLGAYLLSNGENRAVIIKYLPLYNKILRSLNRGPSLQNVLNLVSALLYIEVDEGPTRNKALYFYAQNMIRTSGCLSAMCDLFVTCMMHQDTWRALCRSLAEACRGAAPSQTCCSHLVPVCIERCRQGNIDAIIVLQSLLQNHQQNNKLFHINNGMGLFTRNLLEDTTCLELLNTIIENVTEDFIQNILEAKKMFQELRNLSLSHGCSPQVVEWKTIIFYTCERVLGKQGVVHEDNKQKTVSDDLEIKKGKDSDETQHLLQNIFREVRNFHCNKYYNNERDKEIPIQNHYIKHAHKRPIRNKFLNTNFKSRAASSSFRLKNKDLSCSFLLKINSSNLENKCKQSFNTQTHDSCNRNNLSYNNKSNFVYMDQTTNGGLNFMNIDKNPQTIENEIDFKPAFASTPKKKYFMQGPIIASKSFQQRDRTLRKSTKIYKPLVPNNMNKMKNHSLRAKLLDVVNQSCSTIMNSFKNVFKKKSPTDRNKDTAEGNNMFHNDSCNYSFTNYMRKRDEFLAGECRGIDTISLEKDFSRFTSCSTCNDTLLLREKMKSDRCLKETVKKLKLGINLFGCDFKKISKTFWPKEKYITPNLLYNLYRKLIVK